MFSFIHCLLFELLCCYLIMPPYPPECCLETRIFSILMVSVTQGLDQDCVTSDGIPRVELHRIQVHDFSFYCKYGDGGR